jgi:hypothetical protein
VGGENYSDTLRAFYFYAALMTNGGASLSSGSPFDRARCVSPVLSRWRPARRRATEIIKRPAEQVVRKALRTAIKERKNYATGTPSTHGAPRAHAKLALSKPDPPSSHVPLPRGATHKNPDSAVTSVSQFVRIQFYPEVAPIPGTVGAQSRHSLSTQRTVTMAQSSADLAPYLQGET